VPFSDKQHPAYTEAKRLESTPVPNTATNPNQKHDEKVGRRKDKEKLYRWQEFRTFIKNTADSFNVKGFAENLEDGSVRVVCEGEENVIVLRCVWGVDVPG